MREIDVSLITDAVARLAENINYELSDDVRCAIFRAAENETSDTAKSVFDMMIRNLDTAKEKRIPVCQDTGMAIIFLDVGQEVALVGGCVSDAVNPPSNW